MNVKKPRLAALVFLNVNLQDPKSSSMESDPIDSGPFKVGADGKISDSHEIQLQPAWKQRDLNVVAFVQNSATGEILQTLALGLCE